MIHETNLKTGEKTSREWDDKELDDMASAKDRDKPSALQEWKSEIAETDKEMPRVMENHITDDHNGVCSNPRTQLIYDNKIEIRARKPEEN